MVLVGMLIILIFCTFRAGPEGPELEALFMSMSDENSP